MPDLLDALKKAGIPETSKIYQLMYDILLIVEYNEVSSNDLQAVLQLLSYDGSYELSNTKIPTQWSEFDYGNAKIGSLVKVKEDAYTSETGLRHNGRIGFLLDISGRRCLIRYLGTRGKSDMRHPIDNLQSPKYGVE